MNHINSKVLLGLGVAAAVSLGAALWLSTSSRPSSESPESQSFALADLHDHVNDVKGIGIVVAENKPAVTLVNGDKGWVIQEKAGYPANTGKLRELLLKLADARLLEAKTANEQRYAELAVEDIKSKDAKGVLIKLDGLSKPASLIVGNTSNHGDSTFVRRPDDKQSWLASGLINVERDPVQWLDTALLDIAADRIGEIILTKPGNKSVRLFKQQAGDSNFQVADLPTGRQAADAAVINGLASTLAGLTLQDVASAQSLPAPDDSQLLKARYRRFDGVAIDVAAWTKEDKYYARFSAALDQPQADTAIQSEQAKAKADYDAKQKPGNPVAESSGLPPLAVSDPAKHRQQRLDELTAEVATLNQRWQGWSYTIPAYTYTNMDKTLNDVLKPVEKKTKTETGSKKSAGKH